jgi:hypothetical protein
MAFVDILRGDPTYGDPSRVDFRGRIRNNGPSAVSGSFRIEGQLAPGSFIQNQPIRTPDPPVAYSGNWLQFSGGNDGGHAFGQVTLGTELGPGEEIDLLPLRFLTTGPPFRGTFTVTFTTSGDPSTTTVPQVVGFRSYAEDEEGGTLTLVTRADVGIDGTDPRRVVHQGTLTNGGPGTASGTVTVRATLQDGAAWVPGQTAVAPNPPVGTVARGSWVYGGGGFVDDRTVEQNWALQTSVRAGGTVDLPPVQYVAGSEPFAGTITTDFEPGVGTTVNSPVVQPFTSA